MQSRIVLLFLLWRGVYAHSQTVQFDRESERIMEVILSDRTPVSSALVIYPLFNQWVVPLAELSEGLGIAIQVAPGLGTAEGFIIEENSRFYLDTLHCTVTVHRKTSPYDCQRVVVHSDDIYVETHLLEEWLPLRFSLNLFRSQMVIHPTEKLPSQLRAERERQAERMKGQEEYDPGFPRREISRSWFDGFSFDEQLSFTRQWSPSGAGNLFNHSGQFGTEVLKFETYGFASGNERKIDRWRLNFAQRESDASLGGPLRLREVQFMDVDLPSLPLISEVRTGRGFLFSSYPLNLPSTFESTDFQGPLPAGWEVELYRNEVLVGRQSSDGSGRYQFNKVTLYYGLNRFRFAFYGPHGERRNEYKNYQLDPSLLKPGSSHYRAGFGVLEDSRHRFFGQYAQNFLKFFTTNVGYFQDQRTTLSDAYAFIGLTGLSDLFLFSTTCALNSVGGKACEWGQQTGWGLVSLGTKYARLFNFRSEAFGGAAAPSQEDQITVNLASTIPLDPGIGSLMEFTRKTFVGGTKETRLRHRITTGGDRVTLSHDLNYEFEVTRGLFGRWDIDYLPSLTRFRLGLEYTFYKANSVEAEVQHTLDKRYSFSCLTKYLFTERLTQVRLVATKFMKAFALSIDSAMNSPRDFSAGLLFNFSLFRDPQDNSIHLNRESLVLNGSASVRVFVDGNRNGRFDPGEKPLARMRIIVNQREQDFVTDEEGLLFVNHLKPHSPTDLSLSLRSLEDPFLRPAEPGVRIFPRAGKIASIDLPLVIVGAIDGGVFSIEKSGRQRPRRGIDVELWDSQEHLVQTVKTDFEGLYSFENVAPGTYQIKLSPKKLTELNSVSTPLTRDVTIAAEGSFESGNDFILTPYR